MLTAIFLSSSKCFTKQLKLLAILQTHFSSQMFLVGTQKQKILNVLKLRYLHSIIESESKEPEVKMQSLTILCPGRPDLVLPIPFGNNSKRILFTLKEGSQYRLKFSFTVSNNIVLGLKYTNVVWKTGMKGIQAKFFINYHSHHLTLELLHPFSYIC